MQLARRRIVPALAALIAVATLLAACSGGDQTAVVATATPATAATAPAPPATTAATQAAPSPSFTVVALSDHNVERAFEDLRMLAVEIGIRSAGTAAERDAAAYVARQLEGAGYVVSVEPFETSYRGDHSSVAPAGGAPSVRAIVMNGSPTGEATAPLVQAGLGSVADFEDADVSGAIALLDRGVVTFADKARNAEAAGAIAVIVVNNEGALFGGALGGRSSVTIPIVAAAGRSAEALRALAAQGAPVTLTAEVGTRMVASQNVVGRGQGGTCRGYIGAHYDSVPYGPGANDNASGTALLLELARTHHVEGLCFIAFGAEEIGLLGSRAFVDQHDVSDAAFMLNFDMVARIGERSADGPRFVLGSPSLADRASAVADAVGYGIPPGEFPMGAASDHVSFERAGVPAITVYSGGADFIHTPQDTLDTVYPEDLEIFLEVTTALLRELLAEHGG